MRILPVTELCLIFRLIVLQQSNAHLNLFFHFVMSCLSSYVNKCKQTENVLGRTSVFDSCIRS